MKQAHHEGEGGYWYHITEPETPMALSPRSDVALEQVQSNLAPRLWHRQRCNRSRVTLFLYATEIFGAVVQYKGSCQPLVSGFSFALEWTADDSEIEVRFQLGALRVAKENCKVWWGKQARGAYVVSTISVCGTIAAIQYHTATVLAPYVYDTMPMCEDLKSSTTVTVLYYPKLLMTSKERNKSSVPDVSASMRAETLPSSRKRQIAMLQLAALTRWEFEVMFSTESATNKTNGRNKSVNNDETFTIVTLC
uniref:Uncharacterized protein n=1 Tax=Timema shepardi TaxID=629360 RepID=A0A7R9B290_TIMSH|nr:unnamed protein product [Timema shepardi]